MTKLIDEDEISDYPSGEKQTEKDGRIQEIIGRVHIQLFEEL
jgi:hypothetical protein